MGLMATILKWVIFGGMLVIAFNFLASRRDEITSSIDRTSKRLGERLGL